MLPNTITRTRTEAGAREVGAPADRAAELTVGSGAVLGLRRGARIAPRVLGSGRVVRAALVPTQAGPLAGDCDRVRLHVGAGATLVMTPVAATLALPGAGRTRLELSVEVEAGGRLVLDEPPLIVAAGADVVRTVRLELAAGAVAAVRELVVLGRAGEGAGRLDSTLRATCDGRPLLHDALRVDVDAAYVALAPGHRVVGTACLLGARGGPEPALSGPGALRRATGSDVPSVEAELAAAWRRFSETRAG